MEEMEAATDKIRSKLQDNFLTHVWLINQLNKQHIRTDKSEFSSILRGIRTGRKAEKVIDTSLQILNAYEGQTYVLSEQESTLLKIFRESSEEARFRTIAMLMNAKEH